MGAGLQLGRIQGMRPSAQGGLSPRIAEDARARAEEPAGAPPPPLDEAGWARLRVELNMSAPGRDEGWQLAQARQGAGRSFGGYGPAMKLGNGVSTTPPRAALETGVTEGDVDYSKHIEAYTQPGVNLGEDDVLKRFKETSLDKFVVWGSTSLEGSAWRKGMGISYALTDAIVPGSYGQAAFAAAAGPAIGKGIAWGSSALHSAATKSTLTAWVAEDFGSLASRAGQWLAPTAEKIILNSADRMGLVLAVVPNGPRSVGPGIVEPRVVTYRPATPGAQNHHGVLDVWASQNVPGYVSRAAGSPTVALSNDAHAATNAIYREWLTANYGKPVGIKVDWTSVSPREVFNLSEKMFDAARISPAIRNDYYRSFNRYIYGGGQ
jgi:hypothetical protein